MKKNIILIIVILIILSFATFTLSACRQGKGNSITSGESSKKTVEGEDITIKGFNDYYGCVATVFGNAFGRAEVNTDKKYITEGNGSMHLFIQGDYGAKNLYPNIRFGKDMFESTNDFSEYSKIAMDCYNDTEKELHIMMHLTVIEKMGGSADIPSIAYSLQPKKWTTIIYDFSDGSLKTAFNDLQNVEEIVLQFPEYKQNREDACNSIYIDNFVGVIGSTKEYQPERDKNEMMFFESVADINQFNVRNYAVPYFYNNCILSLNTNKEFVFQGNASMELQRFTNILTVLPLMTECFKGVSLQGYKTLSLDIYNASDILTTVWVVYSTDGLSKKLVKIGLDGYSKGTLTIDIDGANQLTYYEIQFSAVSTERDLQTFYIDNFVRG